MRDIDDEWYGGQVVELTLSEFMTRDAEMRDYIRDATVVILLPEGGEHILRAPFWEYAD